MGKQLSEYDFESSVGYWITTTSHCYQQTLNDSLAPYGITFRQFQVLAWLAYDGELSLGDLARRMMVEPPTLVGILDRMQQEAWIERRSCSADRRRKYIVLCPGAERVWSKVVRCLTQVRHQATKGMSAQELTMLKTLLAKVQRNLKEVDGGDSGPRDSKSAQISGALS